MPTESPIRWGILGTGRIARTFAQDLSLVPGAELAAVGSRRQSSADAFAEDVVGAPAAHGSYEALVEDETVDVVYIATPHSRHAEDTHLALEAGCHVLCEKAFAVNAEEARGMADAARRRGLFLMEAMWTRFHPSISTVRRLVREGAVGPVRTATIDITTIRPTDPEDRLFKRELAGGTLLDLGIYPIAFTFDLFGPPDRMQTSAQIGSTGVDEQCAAIFTYENGLQVTWPAQLAQLVEGNALSAHSSRRRAGGDRGSRRRTRLPVRNRARLQLPPRWADRKPGHAPRRIGRHHGSHG